jgi:hypothetical protein
MPKRAQLEQILSLQSIQIISIFRPCIGHISPYGASSYYAYTIYYGCYATGFATGCAGTALLAANDLAGAAGGITLFYSSYTTAVTGALATYYYFLYFSAILSRAKFFGYSSAFSLRAHGVLQQRQNY